MAYKNPFHCLIFYCELNKDGIFPFYLIAKKWEQKINKYNMWKTKLICINEPKQMMNRWEMPWQSNGVYEDTFKLAQDADFS